MISHFLGREQVEAYCRDLAKRLIELGDEFPLIWFPIGFSGMELYQVILKFIPREHLGKMLLQPLTYKKPKKGTPGQALLTPMEGYTEDALKKEVAEAVRNCKSCVLILDSSIHSGSSMLESVRFVRDLGTSNILTYSLIIKRQSGFIPHYFGLVVGDHDRVLFLLNSIPNNRLSKPKAKPTGILRKLNPSDAHQEYKIETQVPSISKIGWGDLWYEMHAHGFQVYVLELDGKLVGYVKYRIVKHSLLLDVIAVDKNFQGVGAGAALFRWAETSARSASCQDIQLWGIENQVQAYEGAKYVKTGEMLDVGGGERYFHMRKALLYHFDLKVLREEDIEED